MFEIYKACEGRNTYIVSKEPFNITISRKQVYEIRKYAKQHYKCSEKRLEVCAGWILNDELYLENPNKKGAVKHWIAYKKAKENDS